MKIPVDWRTVNLKEFSNVEFKESAAMKSASLATIKNAQGKWLEFVSPKMRCFGLSSNMYDGKQSYSITQAFSENDTEEVKAYRKFLEDLFAHADQFCDGGKKSDPLVQFPKVKDPSRPNEFLKIGKEWVRDMKRSPTVRYKMYPHKDASGYETGCVDVMIYDKKGKPMFHYGNKESEDHFRDKEVPVRTFEAESAAINKGCMVKVLCTARISSTFDGAMFYVALSATQIKRVGDGSAAPAPDVIADFGDDDDDDDYTENVQVVEAVPISGKKKAASAPPQEDDGIEDEIDEAVVAPPVAVAVASDDYDDDAEEAVVVVAPPPPAPKKKARNLAGPSAK